MVRFILTRHPCSLKLYYLQEGNQARLGRCYFFVVLLGRDGFAVEGNWPVVKVSYSDVRKAKSLKLSSRAAHVELNISKIIGDTDAWKPFHTIKSCQNMYTLTHLQCQSVHILQCSISIRPLPWQPNLYNTNEICNYIHNWNEYETIAMMPNNYTYIAIT